MGNLRIKIPSPVIAFFLYTFLVLLIILCLKHFYLIAAPLFFALVITYIFNPLVDWIEKKSKFPRSVVTGLLMIFLIFSFVFLVINLLPNIIDQMKNAAVKIPQFLKAFSIKMEAVGNYITKNFPDYIGKIDIMGKIEEGISGFLTNFSTFLVNAFSSIYGFLITFLYMILIPLFSYFFIKDSKKISENLSTLIPNRYRKRVQRKIRQLDRILSSFIRGQAIVVLILMVLYSVGLSLIGLPFAPLIGFFAGLGDIIPYFGTVVGLIFSLIVGAVHFHSFEKLLLIVLIFALVKGSENWFFYPKIVGKEVGLHFVWVLLSIIIFGQLFGFWGLVIAIPAAAGFKVFIGDLIRFYKNSYFYRKSK